MKTEFPLSLHSKRTKRTFLFIILVLLILYVVLPKLHVLGLNGHLVLPKHWSYIFLAFVSFFVTFLISGVSFSLLAFKRLKIRTLSLVQLAGASLNLLLPTGLGSVSINYIYLRGRQHTAVESGLVVSANNIIGVIANLTMILLMLLFFGLNQSESRLYLNHRNWFLGVIAVLLVLIIAGLVIYHGKGRRIKSFRQQLRQGLAIYKSRSLRLIGAYLCGIMQAGMIVLAFWLCLQAYGIHLSYATSFLIYSFSVLVGTATPTPGGLGGYEASLTAGLVVTNVAGASLALAAVLAYRIISYWLPVTIGAVALFIVNHKQIVRWNKQSF